LFDGLLYGLVGLALVFRGVWLLFKELVLLMNGDVPLLLFKGTGLLLLFRGLLFVLDAGIVGSL
jgi:hypothetical protein